jgi:transketolase
MLQEFAYQIRKIILEQSKRANVGHIGSALSIADLAAALYQGPLTNLDGPDRNRFVLSKGHAALAIYAAMYLKGWIDESTLNGYCGDNTLLGVHPECELPGIDFSTGSLGQGLSMGVGAALGARLQNSERRVFVLLSDAECNEGSVWEAAMFAAHHGLSNLTAILDLNGQQAFGHTPDVLNLSNMAERWRAFGWDVQEVDGHSPQRLLDAMVHPDSAKPQMIIAKTTFGKGVSYMQSQIKWHYWPMSEAEYAQALTEIEAIR